MKRSLLLAAAVLTVIGIGSALWLQPSLGKIHKSIVAEHQKIDHLSAEQLHTLDTDKIVLFDVREQDEFDVSHIEGAIQIQPNIDTAEFTEDYADLLDGKTAIFYCSVGRRSSDLLARLSPSLEAAGVQASANLEGGIFNWINQGKQLMGDKVHPYNAYWGRLIDNADNIAYSPQLQAE